MLREKYEDLKAHVRQHKGAYKVGAGMIIGAGVTYIFKSRPLVINNINQVQPVLAPMFNNIQKSKFGGHAHKIVRCNETGELWETVKSAANAMDVKPSTMSRHLNGHKEHISGKTFSIIGLGSN